MSNLHDRRFERNRPEDKPQDWQYVCIPNKFKAGQIKASIDVGGYYVVLVSRNPIETRNGQPARYETLRFRGSNPQELKDKILKEFPDAIFTPANPEPEVDLKTAHWNERRAEEKRAQQKAADEKFDNRVVAEHRKIESEFTPAQQREAANQSLNLFATDERYSSPESRHDANDL